MPREPLITPLLLLVSAGFVGGCNQVATEMQRAQVSYETARYEDTLVWLRDLEDEAPGMDLELRGRYYYLRGMAEYRLGHRSEALHYLAVAREVTGDEGAGLRDDWQQIMERTLAELTPHGMTHRPPEAGAPAESTSGGDEPTPDEEEETPPR